MKITDIITLKDTTMPSRRKDASSAQDEEEARERKKPTLVNIR